MDHPLTDQDVASALRDINSTLKPHEVDDLLRGIQEDVEDHWHHWQTALEAGELEFRAQKGDTLILADTTAQFWHTEFDVLMDFMNLIDVQDAETPDVVLAAHVNAAQRLTDHSWKTENPVILNDPRERTSRPPAHPPN